MNSLCRMFGERNLDLNEEYELFTSYSNLSGALESFGKGSWVGLRQATRIVLLRSAKRSFEIKRDVDETLKRYEMRKMQQKLMTEAGESRGTNLGHSEPDPDQVRMSLEDLDFTGSAGESQLQLSLDVDAPRRGLQPLGQFLDSLRTSRSEQKSELLPNISLFDISADETRSYGSQPIDDGSLELRHEDLDSNQDGDGYEANFDEDSLEEEDSRRRRPTQDPDLLKLARGFSK